MRRLYDWALPLGCLLALVAACFGSVLVGDEQFAYRDSAHYYYPLYQQVQAEWEAGRVPLWSTQENGGIPLDILDRHIREWIRAQKRVAGR